MQFNHNDVKKMRILNYCKEFVAKNHIS